MNKIDEYLESLPAWQKTNLQLFRKLLHEIEPSITEDWKWNVLVFIFNQKVYFAMAAFKAHTKYNFILNGAVVVDSDKLFNNGFESKKSRGIDITESSRVDEAQLKALIKLSLTL